MSLEVRLFKHSKDHPPNLRLSKCCALCKHFKISDSGMIYWCNRYNNGRYPIERLYVCDDFESYR